MKKLLISLLAMFLNFGCGPSIPPEPDFPKEDDVVIYNMPYVLTYNPIYETADRFSTVTLSRKGTFSMSVNDCEGVALLEGTYIIEGKMLYLWPTDYECDQELEACDLNGIAFTIVSTVKLIISNGLRCISEESEFEVEYLPD